MSTLMARTGGHLGNVKPRNFLVCDGKGVNPVMARKYKLPDFLNGVITQGVYERWLHRKAVVHVRRDRRRCNKAATNEAYKLAIHKAVTESAGQDSYTGEQLDWHLVSQYDNAQSKANRRQYKAQFALLPTADHVNDGLGPADFQICAWRTNDAKNDLPLDEFIALCRRVIDHQDKPRHTGEDD